MAVTIRGSGQVPVQVVQNVYNGSGGSGTTAFSTSSGTWVAMAGVSATITPTNSSNRVLVTFVIPNLYGPGNGQEVRVTIYRNGTNIAPVGTQEFNGLATVMGNGGGVQAPTTISYLDSPATTSAVTYALYWASGSGTVFAGRNAPTFPVILQEIAYA